MRNGESNPLLFLFFTCSAMGACASGKAEFVRGEGFRQERSAEEWKSVLTREEYKVLRLKGTEARGGEYDGVYPTEGHFVCRACHTPLYSAEAKFKSGCGWPAFDKCYKGSVRTARDDSAGMTRIEIMCAACDGHLGHVFPGERMTPTNERHCVNSVSVRYVPAAPAKDMEQVKVV